MRIIFLVGFESCFGFYSYTFILVYNTKKQKQNLCLKCPLSLRQKMLQGVYSSLLQRHFLPEKTMKYLSNFVDLEIIQRYLKNYEYIYTSRTKYQER
jgi:hypothetical protein